MTAITGVEPKLMGIGPAFAIPKVLARAGISKDDVDLYELNEGEWPRLLLLLRRNPQTLMPLRVSSAFASQAVMSIEHIGLDYKKVNPNGGAIALGVRFLSLLYD